MPLTQNEFFKLNVSEQFFNDLYLVVIQLGAILAVVLVFWKDIWPFGLKDNKKPWKKEGIGRYVMADKFSMWFKILVACIPAAVVGVLFDDVLEKIFMNYICVAISLIVFGIAFIIVENYIKGKEFIVKDMDRISYRYFPAYSCCLSRSIKIGFYHRRIAFYRHQKRRSG